MSATENAHLDEFDQALAAQAAEDPELNQAVAEEVEEPPAEPESEAPAAVADEPPAAETEPAAEPEAKPVGVASKDGTRVLPYAALQAERRAARHERTARERVEQELAQTKQQLEDLKAGKSLEAEPASDELSDEELAAVAQDFPQVAKVANQVKAMKAQLEKLAPKAAATEEPEDPREAARESVQADIDSIPLLLEWQASDPEKFARAQAIDNVLKTSRKWTERPQAERFAAVTKQVADEYDIPFADAPRTTTPNKAKNPNEVISNAARAAPNTLSDLKGGAVDQAEVRMDRLPPAKRMAAMQRMTDAEIDAHLAKFG